MAKNFLRINKGVTLRPQSVTPTSPDKGDIYFDSGSNTIKMYNGTAWVDVGGLAPLTINRALISDGLGAVAVSSVTSTELGYLSGVTSSVQTQIDSKQAASTAVTLTGSQTLSNKTIDANSNTILNITDTNIASAAAIAYSKLAALTVGRVLQSNAITGFIEVSSVTNVELGYLSGVTSAVQTQLGSKANTTLSNLTSPTAINQDLLFSATDTINVGSDTSRVNLIYANELRIAASGPKISLVTGNLVAPSGDNSVDYAGSRLVTGITPKLDWSGTDLDINTRKIVNVQDPASAQDVATKNYVDTAAVNSTLSNLTSPTAVNQSLISAANNTLNLGTSTNLWANIYATAIRNASGPNIEVATRELFDSSSIPSVRYQARTLASASGSTSVNYGTGVLSSTSSGTQSINWTSRILSDASAIPTIDYSSNAGIKIGATISFRNQGLGTEIVSQTAGNIALASGANTLTVLGFDTATYESMIVDYKIHGNVLLSNKTGTLYIVATPGGAGYVEIVDTSSSINSNGDTGDNFIFAASISAGVVTVTCNNGTAGPGTLKFLSKKFAV